MKQTVSAFRLRGDHDKPPLRYRECGLDDIYLLSGYEIEDSHHGESLSVKNIDELHRAIGGYLASVKKALSGKELRFLRGQMNLTQYELGRLLGMSSQQVARWEKGQSEIPGPADRLVRGLYIQHAGGKLNLQDLANRLEEFDAPMNERMVFEKTPQGWKYKKAA